jgi:hypothetical protein
MIVSMSPALSAALLMIAGVFQFTPLKQACLRACRTPLGFLLTDWRDALCGAARMGIRHGLYCLGCCWALMALLFVGGAMNLLWISALTLLGRHGEARAEGRHPGEGAGCPHDRGRRSAIDLAGVVTADWTAARQVWREADQSAARPAAPQRDQKARAEDYDNMVTLILIDSNEICRHLSQTGHVTLGCGDHLTI